MMLSFTNVLSHIHSSPGEDVAYEPPVGTLTTLKFSPMPAYFEFVVYL